MKKYLNSDVIFGVIGILVAVFFIINGQSLPGSKNGVPGSNYFPVIAAIGVIIFSVLLVIQGIRNQKSYFKLTAEQKKNLGQMILVLLILAGFLVLWCYIPFLPAALIYVFALAMILKQPVKFAIPYTIGVVLVRYLIFSVAFKVRLNIC